jgi:hypothetical protein
MRARRYDEARSGSDRRVATSGAIPAAAAITFALTVLSAGAAGCGGPQAQETPEVGLEVWLAALRTGDAKGVWDRMSERSRADALLVAGLAAATPEPWTRALFTERLDVNWENTDVKLLPGATDARAELELTGVDATAGKRSARVTMLKEGGTWRVDLPSPPAVAAAAAAPSPVPVAPPSSAAAPAPVGAPATATTTAAASGVPGATPAAATAAP